MSKRSKKPRRNIPRNNAVDDAKSAVRGLSGADFDIWFTTPEDASREYGISVEHIKQWCQCGRVKAVMNYAGKLVIDRDHLKQYIETEIKPYPEGQKPCPRTCQYRSSLLRSPPPIMRDPSGRLLKGSPRLALGRIDRVNRLILRAKALAAGIRRAKQSPEGWGINITYCNMILRRLTDHLIRRSPKHICPRCFGECVRRNVPCHRCHSKGWLASGETVNYNKALFRCLRQLPQTPITQWRWENEMEMLGLLPEQLDGAPPLEPLYEGRDKTVRHRRSRKRGGIQPSKKIRHKRLKPDEKELLTDDRESPKSSFSYYQFPEPAESGTS